MTQPFLSIVTRTHRRPWMLARCMASVLTQTDRDYEHVIVDDQKGLGIKGSHKAVVDLRDEYRGHYIWLLDDDDYLIESAFIASIKRVAFEFHDPPVIFVKASHFLGMLPPADKWEQPPELGYMGMPCMVVRADIWRKHCHAMAVPDYGGDFALALEMWGHDIPFLWLDITAVHIPQRGGAVPEERYAQCLGTLKRIGGLWRPRHQRVLYVGASHLFPPAFCYELKQAGHEITLLEIWPANVRYFEAHGDSFSHIVHGDVRAMPDLPHDHYDIAFWWHGPEHVKRDEVAPTLKALEDIADLVVVACPFGQHVQADWPNPYQDHLCALYPEDLKRLGYQTQTLGDKGGLGAQLMAWKGATMAENRTDGDVPESEGMQSSPYDGEYVKLEGPGNYQYWRVENGERIPVRDIQHMYDLGLAPVHAISREELAEIPIQGE